jgi:hypothetical protein
MSEFILVFGSHHQIYTMHTYMEFFFGGKKLLQKFKK